MFISLKKQTLILGFTLVEILIVISIIGVLIVALISALNPIQQIRKSRDSRKRNDLKQYQIALENYSVKNGGVFPPFASSAVDPSSNLCGSGKALEVFMSGCPSDSGSTYKYRTPVGGVEYVLWAQLEATSNFWVVCSNGKIGERASAPGSGVCPL